MDMVMDMGGMAIGMWVMCDVSEALRAGPYGHVIFS